MNLLSSFVPVRVGSKEIISYRSGNDGVFLDAVNVAASLFGKGASEEQLLEQLRWVIDLLDQANTSGPNNDTYLYDSIHNLRQLVQANLSEVGTWVQY